MPDNLKWRCHQCRKPTPTTDKEVFERVREWVEKDKAWAQAHMAHYYLDGKFGLKQSYVMAAMLFEKAVGRGHSDAMFNLACLHERGQGVVQSHKKAVKLYTMAAERGHVKAMFNLGNGYIQGRGVDQSYESARKWWAQAADEGSEVAVKNLKQMDEFEATAATITTSFTTTTPSSHAFAPGA